MIIDRHSTYARGFAHLAIAIGTGMTAAYLLGFDSFSKISMPLLVIFSIMAGMLAQVMVFTGMAIDTAGLSDDSLSNLEVALDAQQFEWKLQFYYYVSAALLCAVPEVFSNAPQLAKDAYAGISIAVATFALIRSLHIPKAIISLQRLRLRIARKVSTVSQSTDAPPVQLTNFVGPKPHQDHGKVIDLPSSH